MNEEINIFSSFEYSILIGDYCGEQKCGFCFHTTTSSYVAPLADAKRAMAMLAAAGMKKVSLW